MVHSVELIRGIVQYDLDADFLRAVATNLCWGYRQLYDRLCEELNCPDEIKIEQFNRARGDVAVRAMIAAAKQHCVPWSLQRLQCNGQSKLLIKAGRVVMIQEPMAAFGDEPRIADYKKELARTYGLVRQLELNLGDQPDRILDWSGEVLAVLLHGTAGTTFSELDRELGGLYLAVPDAAYLGWVLRLDFYNLAMFGATTERASTSETPPLQADRVHVRVRRKTFRTGTAE